MITHYTLQKTPSDPLFQTSARGSLHYHNLNLTSDCFHCKRRCRKNKPTFPLKTLIALHKHNFTSRYVNIQRGKKGLRGSLRREERDRGTLKEQIAKSERRGRWLRKSEELEEAAGFPEQNRGRDWVYKLHFPSLPIPFLPCHFLSNRWLRCSARPDTAQLGPISGHSPSSAASPRPGPGAGPGPSRSPAPCRSAPRRPRFGCWQRDNLPCQQKKPECATEKLSGVKRCKNKKGGEKKRQRPKTERRDGEGTRPRKVVFFSRRFQQ